MDKKCWSCSFNKWAGMVYSCSLLQKPSKNGRCTKWAGEYYRTTEDGEVIQRARLKKVAGRYAFETKLFDEDYVLNMNMPFFNTPKQAVEWIGNQGKWNI